MNRNTDKPVVRPLSASPVSPPSVRNKVPLAVADGMALRSAGTTVFMKFPNAAPSAPPTQFIGRAIALRSPPFKAPSVPRIQLPGSAKPLAVFSRDSPTFFAISPFSRADGSAVFQSGRIESAVSPARAPRVIGNE